MNVALAPFFSNGRYLQNKLFYFFGITMSLLHRSLVKVGTKTNVGKHSKFTCCRNFATNATGDRILVDLIANKLKVSQPSDWYSISKRVNQYQYESYFKRIS